MWILSLAHLNFAAVFILFASACVSVPRVREEVTPELGRGILKHALSRIGKKYHWTGNGPERFDCSGLLVYSYQQALGKRRIFFDGTRQQEDANIDWIVNHNAVSINAAEARAGDLVYIADAEGKVVHGGIFVEVKGNFVLFVNASGFYKRVCLDEWSLDQTVRNQGIAGFGRFLMP